MAASVNMAKRHVIKLAGIDFVPEPSGALFAPDLKTLLVADLHLEQGTSLARRGMHVPPFDTAATLDLLQKVIAATKPWRLVLLGDSFHDRFAHAMMPNEHRTRLLDITSAIETIWISGNHDPDPPSVGGFAVAACQLGPITLRHEPALKVDDEFEIAGHLHPGAVVVQRGIATRTKCFVADNRRLIMPAFGAYTGALNVRSKAFAGVFEPANTHVWMLGRTDIHRFPLSRVT